jgi:hypothetical protein
MAELFKPSAKTRREAKIRKEFLGESSRFFASLRLCSASSGENQGVISKFP